MIKKSIYIVLGFLTLALAIAGIILPGLPATPFLLLTAWLWAKSSGRLSRWLLSHKWLGGYIRNVRERRGMTLRSKVIAIAFMLLSVGISVIFFIRPVWMKWIVGLAGLSGCVFLILFPTVSPEKNFISEDEEPII